MAVPPARRSGAAPTKPSVADAKRLVLDFIAQGKSVEEAANLVGRSKSAYEQWRFNDPQFRADVDRVREARAAAKDRGVEDVAKYATMSFEDFRKEFLGQDTYRHQRAWIDVIEGRGYKPLPGEKFTQGRTNRILINTPPFHAKSVTMTVEYSVYRICMNPNIRIVIVSKTQALAKKFLLAIKKRLTDRRWSKLQAAFAPDGGFKGDGPWTSTQIYVGNGDSEEKDPTVEALGVGGSIYGQRADMIILDDVADVHNAHLWEKHIEWLDQDVDSRLSDGLLLIVGTRVGTMDIYSELMNPDRYLDGNSPWTHLAQPAVLAYAEDPKDWDTLWPRSSRPLDENNSTPPDENGLYPAWDGVRLAATRKSKSAKIWSLVYQQQTAGGEDQVFKPACVWGSVNRLRKPGPLTAGGMGHPRSGGEGMYTIASMDPAMTGDTFTIVGKVNRADKKRWIENAWVQPSPSPTYIREIIKRVTVEYGVNEWVIEKNAFQVFLVTDPEINNFLASRGVRLTPHYSGSNKSDPDFGVASVAPLFGTTRRLSDGAGREVFNADSNLIELPDPDYSQGVKTLIEELLTWVPGKRGKDLRQDGPMALWFLELRARVILGHGQSDKPATTHMAIPFMSRGRAALRATPPPLFRRRYEEVNVA